MVILKNLTDNGKYIIYMRERSAFSVLPWEILVCPADRFGNYDANRWPVYSKCSTNEDAAYYEFVKAYEQWNKQD